MTCLERMKSVFAGENPDRTPFVPSIYEHGAALIGETPSRVSQDVHLMAKAAITAYEQYEHDLVTVGIDIYNIEAEAFGCHVKRFDDNAIPAIDGHPLGEKVQLDSRALTIPSVRDVRNRLELMIEASLLVYKALKSETMVYACMAGPFSQAVELRGFDRFVLDMFNEPTEVHALLKKTAELTLQQAIRLSNQGVGINIYESWATLPLINPSMFKEFVVPYEKYVVREIKSRFRTPPPAVIMGGDTSILMDFFIDIDTALVVADYMTDFSSMLNKLHESGSSMVIRGCLDPKRIEKGDWEALRKPIAFLAEKSKNLTNFVWGCGCVSFDTPSAFLLTFKQMCLEASKEQTLNKN